MADWINKDDELPAKFTQVDAKDDEGNEFTAMLVDFDGWAYWEPGRYGVDAIVKFWRKK